jgi:hypothetical protein
LIVEVLPTDDIFNGSVLFCGSKFDCDDEEDDGVVELIECLDLFHSQDYHLNES